MEIFLDIAVGLLAFAVLVWARPLSLRYNGWTTRFRERHPNFNPPPTPEWRERNTKIMTVMFRIIGIFFVMYAILLLLGHMKAR
jgi:hypothetical protein